MAAGKIMRVAEDDRPRSTKNVYVYKAGDRYFSGVRIPVNHRRYRTVDALLDDLTAKIPGLQRGARNLATSRGKHCIKSLTQLEHLGRSVLHSYNLFIFILYSAWHRPRGPQHSCNRGACKKHAIYFFR
jgi:hypothetical protein